MKPKFKLGAKVRVKGTDITYIIKDIVIEEEYNSIMYNDFTTYTGPEDNSFYESELTNDG